MHNALLTTSTTRTAAAIANCSHAQSTGYQQAFGDPGSAPAASDRVAPIGGDLHIQTQPPPLT